MSTITNNYLLTIKVEGAIKRINFGLASELTHLCKRAVLHYDFFSYLTLAIRNKNGSFLFVSFVKLLFEEYTCFAVLEVLIFGVV